MAGFEDFENVAASDFSPGAQVPLSGATGATAATQSLAAAAYRDDALSKLVDANGDASVKAPKVALFEPNFGEAFSLAMRARTLGAGRKPLVHSFGIEPRTVVEHCLAAIRIRKERDLKLTVIMLVCGVLFLPGTLLWLGGFQLRRMFAGSKDKKMGAYGWVAMIGIGVVAVMLLAQLPLASPLGLYAAGMLVAPALGWLLAKQFCERTANVLRDQWSALLGGGTGAKIPEAVPKDPGDAEAESIRLGLAKLGAEQAGNLVHYAGPKGILGMGTRWGSWQMAEELVPEKEGADINPFRSWDVARAVYDQLRMLERTPIHTGGFPRPSIRHWIVSPIGEGAKGISHPKGQEVDGYRYKEFEVQRICNEQQFGSGDRHYLGVQFVLWDGQLVITLMITVTVLHNTLRVEVTGHALGPVNPLFNSGPSAPTKTVAKSVKFWETRTIKLPLVQAPEVVRLSVRAPLTYFPPVLEFLGGKLNLPEPFGLRHAWADKPWRHRFMADDALRTATPVLRAVHTAVLKVLEENGCRTDKFGARSLTLSGQVQAPVPGKADEYNA